MNRELFLSCVQCNFNYNRKTFIRYSRNIIINTLNHFLLTIVYTQFFFYKFVINLEKKQHLISKTVNIRILYTFYCQIQSIDSLFCCDYAYSMRKKFMFTKEGIFFFILRVSKAHVLAVVIL